LNKPFGILKPGLSARNLLAARSETADSSRDEAAHRNDNSFGDFQAAGESKVLGADPNGPTSTPTPD
jgi:hypothetical protein